MSEHVSWILQVAIREGRFDAFKTLMVEMVAATEANEPGALAYEWTVSEDLGTCHIHERYRDSAAVMTHLKWFGKECAERFMAVCEPRRITVYGTPDDAVRKALDRMGAVYMTPIAGFAR
jgi:quinol monooxygenase YgiN